jgi:hypothetical protein
MMLQRRCELPFLAMLLDYKLTGAAHMASYSGVHASTSNTEIMQWLHKRMIQLL